MKIAIVGSRDLSVKNLAHYLPPSDRITEIVSGGARGIDTCAAAYARTANIKLTEFLPDYEKYGRQAPLIRNLQIIEYADCVLAFWDGQSRGTGFVISQCKNRKKPIRVYIPSGQSICTTL